MNFIRKLLHWQRHNKRRALASLCLCHNRPSMPISNFPADGQAHSGALVFGPAMQALTALAAPVDPDRPLVEYYRRHDEIELWVPVLPIFR